MGAAELVRALEAQDDFVCMGMAFADRLQAAVDEAYVKPNIDFTG